MGAPLTTKDVNSSVQTQDAAAMDNGKPSSAQTLEHHRQVLHSKMEEEKQQEYVSPSDNIMSPCTAKLSALKGRAVGKAKPKSLFAQTSAKKFEGKDIFGSSKAVVPPAGSQSGI
ncbi:uncharacterized protein F4812DRAFT_442657 [Daldinia caldariorum]|uniref:uncharacterized protein n=1 Tax=Daldinia caldariorum TaxID=326644 RepID=UPI002008AFF0|nr:uncharacterized protein F4812DRAFT_442657 [Daldinia caldariorum]KAI1464556.1 hypothetical protein F4812DRAFT_442657 [Daldinia caldariorum]